MAERLLKFTFETLLNKSHDDLSFFDERIEKGLIAKLQSIVSSEFVRMDYSEAIGVLKRANEKFEFPINWGMDLQSEHERYLTERHVKRPVIVMNYPKDIKAFYMRVNDDGRTVAAMDVLAPGIGEIIGGSQREERLDVLDMRMDERGVDKELYGWYRDLRRYGTVPHADSGCNSSAPSPTSLAFPTCAMLSHFRERQETQNTRSMIPVSARGARFTCCDVCNLSALGPRSDIPLIQLSVAEWHNADVQRCRSLVRSRGPSGLATDLYCP